MFCDKCGTQSPPARNSAAPAGRRLAPRPLRLRLPRPGPSPTDAFGGTFRFWRAFGWPPEFLRLVEVCWIFRRRTNAALPDGLGNRGHYGNWPFNFLPFGLYSIGGVLAIFGVAHLILAWGLFQREPWARL